MGGYPWHLMYGRYVVFGDNSISEEEEPRKIVGGDLGTSSQEGRGCSSLVGG